MAHAVVGEETGTVPPAPAVPPVPPAVGGGGRQARAPRPPVRRYTRRIPRPRLPTSTPARLRWSAGAVVLCATALAAYLMVSGGAFRGAWQDIGRHDAPRVQSATQLYFALNDMDAQVANQLMDGSSKEQAEHRAQSAGIYDRRRAEAGGELEHLAEAAAGDGAAKGAVAKMITDVGTYEERASAALLLGEKSGAPTGRPTREVVLAHREATDFMAQVLLPEADRLVESNNGAFETRYTTVRSDLGETGITAASLGLLLLGVLIAFQVFLARRFHRIVNVPLAAATVLTALLLGLGLSFFAGQREDLRVARRDSFDSVFALSRARALSYEANADESRYLLDADRRTQYEQSFFDKSQRLLRLPGSGIHTYDRSLADALAAYGADHSDLRFTGYYGDEFRNITFSGERTAAERTVRAYQDYERDDRMIRALVESGKTVEAVRLCNSYRPGGSNYHLELYDKELGKLIEVNAAVFRARTHDGATAAGYQPWLLGTGALAVAGLAVLGVRARLAEFR
ncbi:hypothetical protein [Streptomyces olivoreticuli]|uniref:hypothetical protein n=1 Tax=Streptomyces olivoreticuli TaxID=68246 RepID=UPI0013C2BB3F|nr:hypothetical protein [Streptomyces olivoreticuli]